MKAPWRREFASGLVLCPAPRQCPDVPLKSVSTYANSILATREAKADGLRRGASPRHRRLSSPKGGENVFLVKRGVLYEPEITSALDGVTRRTVLELAGEMGLPTGARRITRTNSTVPTRSCSRHRRRNHSGRRGGPPAHRRRPAQPVTRELQRRYFACVHGDDAGTATG